MMSFCSFLFKVARFPGSGHELNYIPIVLINDVPLYLRANLLEAKLRHFLLVSGESSRLCFELLDARLKRFVRFEVRCDLVSRPRGVLDLAPAPALPELLKAFAFEDVNGERQPDDGEAEDNDACDVLCIH